MYCTPYSITSFASRCVRSYTYFMEASPWHGLFLRRSFYTGRVILFEPNLAFLRTYPVLLQSVLYFEYSVHGQVHIK